jgi:hypothetical protein
MKLWHNGHEQLPLQCTLKIRARDEVIREKNVRGLNQ